MTVHYEFGYSVTSFLVPHVIILLHFEMLGAIIPYINVITVNLNDLFSPCLFYCTQSSLSSGTLSRFSLHNPRLMWGPVSSSIGCLLNAMKTAPSYT